jgi:hypothetical protein
LVHETREDAKGAKPLGDLVAVMEVLAPPAGSSKVGKPNT